VPTFYEAREREAFSRSIAVFVSESHAWLREHPFHKILRREGFTKKETLRLIAIK
jgi:hypothetical protein